MIEKQDFYHGAALSRLIDDGRCTSISKEACVYQINGTRAVLIKYSTKAGTPWGFSFSEDDMQRLLTAASEADCRFVALVCGGDGICAVPWEQVLHLLNGIPGWISAKRLSNKAYSVSGPAGALKNKVPMNRWPLVLFQAEENAGNE